MCDEWRMPGNREDVELENPYRDACYKLAREKQILLSALNSVIELFDTENPSAIEYSAVELEVRTAIEKATE